MAVQLVRQPLLDSEIAQDIPDIRSLIVVDGLVVQCAYCGAFKTFLGYRGHGPILQMLGKYRVSHGVCKPCYGQQMARIRRELAH